MDILPEGLMLAVHEDGRLIIEDAQEVEHMTLHAGGFGDPVDWIESMLARTCKALDVKQAWIPDYSDPADLTPDTIKSIATFVHTERETRHDSDPGWKQAREVALLDLQHEASKSYRPTYAVLIREAAGLTPEDENRGSEYERGILELLARTYALPDIDTADRSDMIRHDLRVAQEVAASRTYP